MKLFTEIPITPAPESVRIDYDSKILMLGSCFVEHIGNKLQYFKFRTLQNPFGVLFQPKAIAQLIDAAVTGKVYQEGDVFHNNDIWQSFDAHSQLSDVSKTEVLTRLNTAVTETYEALKSSTHIVITLGTAWVYTHLESDRVVANCHKVPQHQFKKTILSVAEIVETLERILFQIKSVNAEANVIFTVSPVRHIKDGFIENTQSKAHLITAIHQILGKEAVRNSFYFPAYELMMDELRDYRFYEADMVHPNAVAVNYIWQVFVKTWFLTKVLPVMKTVDVIQKGLQHKPFQPDTEKHQKFLTDLHQKIAKIQVEYDFMVFNS
ncbi:GSCFA domain-containing protein [Formosa sp. A9]|uniref:GSCFA domain-containing protein n=1 Tax=Formosa sp. A9 TaxID=3442641 RepID=UPI003EB908E1